MAKKLTKNENSKFKFKQQGVDYSAHVRDVTALLERRYVKLTEEQPPYTRVSLTLAAKNVYFLVFGAGQLFKVVYKGCHDRFNLLFYQRLSLCLTARLQISIVLELHASKWEYFAGALGLSTLIGSTSVMHGPI